MSELDYFENLVTCKLCEDLFCTKCEVHYYDCDCKGPFSDETDNEEDWE